MKERKRNKLLSVGLLAAALLMMCFSFTACAREEEKTVIQDKVFIVLGSSVMGYWEDGGWHSLDRVLYDQYTAPDAPQKAEGKASIQAYLYQMLEPENYYAYDSKTGAVTAINKVYIPEQLELGSLDLTGNIFADSSFYGNEMEALFGDYQQQTAVDEYGNSQDYFTLPIAFTEERLKALPVPNDLFYLGFLDENDKDIRSPGIVLSQKADGFPADLQVREEGTEEEDALVQAHLDSVDMGDSDFVITEVWTADVDGDGKEEKLIIAKTPINEGNYPIIKEEDLTNDHAAVFILALLVDEGEATPLFYQQEPIKKAYEQCLKNDPNYKIYLGDGEWNFIFLGIETCLGLDVNGIFDFNGDGNYEICLGNICWDCPEKRVLELQKDGSWKTVLYGNFVW